MNVCPINQTKRLLDGEHTAANYNQMNVNKEYISAEKSNFFSTCFSRLTLPYKISMPSQLIYVLHQGSQRDLYSIYVLKKESQNR